MNQKNNILKTYSGSCPIFPLPNFVMFPAVGNEFIIFEPRYIEMINYIKDKERFITMALLKAGSDPLQHKIHKPAAEFKAADLTEIAIRWGYPVKPDLFELKLSYKFASAIFSDLKDLGL